MSSITRPADVRGHHCTLAGAVLRSSRRKQLTYHFLRWLLHAVRRVGINSSTVSSDAPTTATEVSADFINARRLL